MVHPVHHYLVVTYLSLTCYMKSDETGALLGIVNRREYVRGDSGILQVISDETTKRRTLTVPKLKTGTSRLQLYNLFCREET